MWALGKVQALQIRPITKPIEMEQFPIFHLEEGLFRKARKIREGKAGKRTAQPLVVVVVDSSRWWCRSGACGCLELQAIRWSGTTDAGTRRDMGRSLSLAAAIVAVTLVCFSGLCRGERLGARECEDLGFTGLALCSDCNSLSEFVKDQGTAVSHAFWPFFHALLVRFAI